MLRESHTIAKTHTIALSLLTLLAVWPALAPACADAFSFGRHRKADAASAQPAAQPEREQDKPETDQDKKEEAKQGAEQETTPAPVEVKTSTEKTDPAEESLTKSVGKAVKPDLKAPDAKFKEPNIIHRKDFSGSFTFVLPEGWGTYQIPYQTHDVLSLRENDNQSATISFADELGKHDLEKLKDSTVENNKKLLQKYELVEAKMLALPSGQPCAKIVSLGQIDEVDTRQVQYIVSLKKKHFLVATLTVTKPVGEKYDKLLQDVVASISTNVEPAKTTK
jgi:hypothetical protein